MMQFSKVRNRIACLFLLPVSAFVFFGCGDKEEEVELGENVYQFEDAMLSLSGVSGKTIYLAKVNGGRSENDKPLKITSQTGVSASAVVAPSLNLAEDDDTVLPKKKYYVVSQEEKEMAKEFGRLHVQKYGKPSRAAIQALYATHTSSLNVSSEEAKGIYIETESGFEQQDAYLLAQGEYCNVWVTENLYSSDEIATEKAEEVKAGFDKLYPVVTKVFGVESDKLYCVSIADDGKETKNIEDMATAKDSDGELINDTGTKINIVLCDLPGDYEGYFAPKDYYYYDTALDETDEKGNPIPANIRLNASNFGKYFYLDAPAMNESLDGAFLTLAHEFQHMIQFNVKQIQQNITSSTFYDEMCSMVCEDMMADFFGVKKDDTPRNRLPMFNLKYTEVGTNEWQDEGDLLHFSYAQSYAFGAWIAREFGGAALFKEMLSNDAGDIRSVIKAVNKVSGTEYTESQLLERYIQALVFNKEPYTDHPTMNQDAKQTLSYVSGNTTYSYPMSKINLWKLNEEIPTFAGLNTSTTYYKYDGPKYLGADNVTTVRPFGFTLHKIGTADADSVTLKLSGTPSGDTKYYVLVQ